jgi:hypothetical protein
LVSWLLGTVRPCESETTTHRAPGVPARQGFRRVLPPAIRRVWPPVHRRIAPPGKRARQGSARPHVRQAAGCCRRPARRRGTWPAPVGCASAHRGSGVVSREVEAARGLPVRGGSWVGVSDPPTGSTVTGRGRGTDGTTPAASGGVVRGSDAWPTRRCRGLSFCPFYLIRRFEGQKMGHPLRN